jgi:hypothetical protein
VEFIFSRPESHTKINHAIGKRPGVRKNLSPRKLCPEKKPGRARENSADAAVRNGKENGKALLNFYRRSGSTLFYLDPFREEIITLLVGNMIAEK